MDPFKLKSTKRGGPEAKIQEGICNYLKTRDWLVIETHGNMFQMGLPDIYAVHYTLGYRWIEVKNPTAYHFTPAQNQLFPQLHAKGIGIWILTAYDEYEMEKLNMPPNWWRFLGKTSHSRGYD